MVDEVSEKRKFVRANFPCKIIISMPQEHVVSTHTENIGAGGVRVIIEEKIDISSLVGLEVYLPKNAISCKGRIVWVVEKMSAYRDGFVFYDTGIEFYDIQPADKRVINSFVQDIVSDSEG